MCIFYIVLARVKVSLTDTIIQVNYENNDSSKLFLRLKIKRLVQLLLTHLRAIVLLVFMMDYNTVGIY